MENYKSHNVVLIRATFCYKGFVRWFRVHSKIKRLWIQCFLISIPIYSALMSILSEFFAMATVHWKQYNFSSCRFDLNDYLSYCFVFMYIKKTWILHRKICLYFEYKLGARSTRTKKVLWVSVSRTQMDQNDVSKLFPSEYLLSRISSTCLSQLTS